MVDGEGKPLLNPPRKGGLTKKWQTLLLAISLPLVLASQKTNENKLTYHFIATGFSQRKAEKL